MSTFISLLSGGLDSTVSTFMAYQEGRRGEILFFDYGQKSIKREWSSVKKISKYLNLPLRKIELPFLKQATQTSLVMNDKIIPQIKMAKLDDRSETEKSAQQVWVPNRNGVFLNIAAALAEGYGYGEIIVGFNAEEAITFPDNSSNFVSRAEQFFQLSTLKGLKVTAPTLGMNKTEIAQKALELEIPLDFFWSCYNGFRKMCGNCESCLRSIRAFRNVGVWKRAETLFLSPAI